MQVGATGELWIPGFNALVRVEPCGNTVCGRIVWLWDEAAKSVSDKNPLIGRVVIEQIRTARAGMWHGGRIYNPQDGRNYKGWL